MAQRSQSDTHRRGVHPSQRLAFIVLGCITGLSLGILYHKTLATPSLIMKPRHQEIHLTSLSSATPTITPAITPTVTPIITATLTPTITPTTTPNSNPSAPSLTSASIKTTSTPNPAPPGTTIHTVFTSDGSPYLSFQSRILYGTYRLVQARPEGRHLTGFTRILHRTTTDNLMDEIPTFHTQPTNPDCERWCEFPVATRPAAFSNWLSAALNGSTPLQGDWILLLEGDFTWMKPLQPPSALDPTAHGWGFMYTYMVPEHFPEIMAKLNPGHGWRNVPKTGPAPMMMRPQEWKRVSPLWVSKTNEIEGNNEYKQPLGWIREMYAFDIALAMSGVNVQLEWWPNGHLMVHLPFEKNMGNAAMVHYTYGTGFGIGGKQVWQFDKRTYSNPDWVRKVPRIPDVPPYQAGMVMTLFAKGEPVSPELRDSMAAMIQQMNTAIDQLPELKA